jgi:hypothetical protein
MFRRKSAYAARADSWAALAEPVFAELWDNEADAVWDSVE